MDRDFDLMAEDMMRLGFIAPTADRGPIAKAMVAPRPAPAPPAPAPAPPAPRAVGRRPERRGALYAVSLCAGGDVGGRGRQGSGGLQLPDHHRAILAARVHLADPCARALRARDPHAAHAGGHLPHPRQKLQVRPPSFSNQSINQSIDRSINQFVNYFSLPHPPPPSP